MPQLESSDTVDGRFEVEEVAGAGGMGQVYRCRDLASGRTVALKVMNVVGDSNRGRFAREVKVLAELRHPNIVAYVGHGDLSDGNPYLAMEWIEGTSLDKAVAERKLPVGEAIALFRRLCDALGQAHGRGIVHRDIKPENIILEGGELDRPKLVDFGLARAVNPTQAITQAGVMVGTPAYMAPEQARRESELDPRADVFSLGCVLFECLAGHPAFRGPNLVSVLCKILLDDPPWLGDVRDDLPEQLVSLVASMLSKDADSRPADASAVRAVLAGVDAERADRASKRPALGEGEQRYVSVILAGWPPADSEETPRTALGLPRVLRGMRRAIAPFDTELHQMVDGTVVLTLVGSGTAQDRVARAARCALCIRDIIPKEPVVMATGRGVLRARQPIGAVIDEAASLLHLAAVGRRLQAESDANAVTVATAERRGEVRAGLSADAILLDDVSAKLLDARFELERTPDGYELLSYQAQPVQPHMLLGRVMPCVGRTRELSILRAAWEECIDESAAQAVVITGEAGVGKSRLVRQWLTELQEEPERPRVLSVRADAMGAGGAFGMLARLVRVAAGAHDDFDAGEAQLKIHSLVQTHVPASERQRVAEFLGEMVGVAPDESGSVALRAARRDPVLRGDQIRRAFQDWLAAESGARPIVIILEDMHWGDLPTVELIDSALRTLKDQPLCLVALGRPTLDDRFPRLWSDRNATTVALGPLRKRASMELVRAAVDDIEDVDAESIASRSGGHPFFIEELVRAHAEQRPAAPETVLASLQARLDDFSTSQRLVLRAASILGAAFPGDAVAALVGDQASDVAGLLQALVEREVLVDDDTGDAAAPHTLSFAQGLWCEAAYASLTEDDRRLGHGLAAAWLQRHRPGDAIAVAEHYARGAVEERAAHYFGVAARHALLGGDWEAALERAERAESHSRTGAEGDVPLVQAVAHKWRGDNDLADGCATQAMARLTAGRVPWYEAAGEAAAARGKLGRVDALASLADTLAETAAGDEEARRARIIAVSRATTQLVLAGRTDAADSLLRLLSIEQIDPSVEGWVYEARAVRAGSARDPGGRIGMAEQAARCFQIAGDLRNACLQLTSVGFALNEAGDYARARKSLGEAIELGTRMDLDNAVATAEAQVGRALSRLGEHPAAQQTLRRACDALLAQKNARLAGVARTYLAWSRYQSEGAAAAEPDARDALHTLKDAPLLRAGASALLARLLLEQGDVEAAAPLCADAMQILDELGVLPTGESWVRLARIELLLAQGATREAGDCAREACAKLDEQAAQLQEGPLADAYAAVDEHTAIRRHAAG